VVSHVRARLVNGLCHGFTDTNGLRLCKGLIDGEACPREVVNGSLRVTDARMSNGLWVREGLIDGEPCPREGGSQWRSVL
jgi:hypothetical protein